VCGINLLSNWPVFLHNHVTTNTCPHIYRKKNSDYSNILECRSSF